MSVTVLVLVPVRIIYGIFNHKLFLMRMCVVVIMRVAMIMPRLV